MAKTLHVRRTCTGTVQYSTVLYHTTTLREVRTPRDRKRTCAPATPWEVSVTMLQRIKRLENLFVARSVLEKCEKKKRCEMCQVGIDEWVCRYIYLGVFSRNILSELTTLCNSVLTFESKYRDYNLI